MVNAKQIKQLAERLAKTGALVAAGAVFPVAGLAGYAVLRNGDGTQMYLAQHEAGKEHCTCSDWEHRQSKVNAPCKHILAAQLQAGRTQTTEPVERPAPQPQPERKRSKLLEWQDEDEASAVSSRPRL